MCLEDVRDALALELKNRCFMQSAIAEKAGLTKQQLSDVINKRRRLEANEMLRICKVTGIAPNALFEAVAQDSAQEGGYL